MLTYSKKVLDMTTEVWYNRYRNRKGKCKMPTPEQQEINKLEYQVEIILDLMKKTEDYEEVQALDTAYWVMMNQIVRLKNQ